MTAPLTAPVEVKFKASGVSEVQRGLRLVGNAGDVTGRQVGGSMRQIAGGVEMIARQGKVTGESLKQIISQGAEMAFMFGAAGPIVGGLAIVGVAIYEHIAGNMQKARDEVNKTRTAIEEMRVSTDLASVGKTTSTLFSGQAGAIRKEGESASDFLARSRGISGLRSRQQQLYGMLPRDVADYVDKQGKYGGSMGYGKNVDKAANELVEIRKLLASREPEYQAALDRSNALMALVGRGIQSDNEEARKKSAQDLLEAMAGKVNMPALIGAGDAAAFKKRFPAMLTPGQTQGPGMVGGLDGHRTFGLSAKTTSDTFKETFVNPLGESITRSIGEGIGGAISAGFDAAFAKGGNIKGVLAAFGGVALRTMGGVFKDIGMQSLLGLEFMATIKAAIATWNPALGIAASMGLIALGSAMQSAAGRMGANAAGGGGGGGGSSGAPTTIIDRGTINPAMSAATSITPRSTITLQPIIIGVNDASAQRGILELVRNAERRGAV